MNHVIRTAMLAVTGFIIFLFTMIYGEVAKYVFPIMKSTANNSGVGARCNPIYTNLELVGWIVFCIFMVGAIVEYMVASHQDEYESYEDQQNRRL